MADSSDLDLAAVALAGARAREDLGRRRLRQSLAVSGSVSVVWLLAVTASGLWARVGEHWVAALTMVFGSFVAGATPQGGGAVAFPVFTKGLSVPAEVARSFSLCIQAVGMTSAAAAILISRRRIVWRAAALGSIVGSAAFLATLVSAGDRSAPFWPTDLPGAYVKVTFTIVLCAMAWVVVLGRRVPIREVADGLPDARPRLVVGLVVASALGGVAAALVGSGLDVLLYLFIVVLAGVRPGVGVPTSVVAMAAVSIVGFAVLGLIDGQLFVGLDGDRLVTTVGGHRLAEPTPLRRADLFGMWLAAAPVVAWGAPLGSLVASRLRPDRLVQLVLALAAAEILSTVVFLSELRSDPVLAFYAVVGVVLAISGLSWSARHRHRLLGLPERGSPTLTRDRVEVADHYSHTISSEPPAPEGGADGRHR